MPNILLVFRGTSGMCSWNPSVSRNPLDKALV